MKVCTKCGAEGDEEKDFYKSRGKPRAWCKKCHVADGVARGAANPEKYNARTKRWRDAHPGRATEITLAWRKRHPEQYEQMVRGTRFKIDFQAMWEAQKGLCDLCGDPMLREGREKLSVVVDHDRSCCGKKSCGKCVRGLIHWKCNLVLGYAQDDARILRCAADYVERHRRPTAAPQAEPASVVALCARTG